MALILIVDDEPSLRDSLSRALRPEHEVETGADVPSAERRLLAGGVDLLLTDIRLGDRSGLDLIASARTASSALRIVAMTAFGSVDVAVEAMRKGADDFLEKPFRVDALTSRLHRLLEPARLAGEVARLTRQNEALREELEVPEGDLPLVGSSLALARVKERIERVARATASVLVRGETGTGKELVARRIHQLSGRAERPFVAMNCGAVPEGLMESELFGHEKGGFTGADKRRLGKFELADGGSLFLDELGELAPTLQTKLLRVLQERSFERVGGTTTVRVDVRVIAATNRDLEAAIREQNFREDLYYRLNVVTIDVPPLRERPEDIPALVDLFLARYGRRADGTTVRVSPEAQGALRAHAWPGNVRQLENAIQRGTILCDGDEIGVEDVSLELSEAVPSAAESSSGLDLRQALAQVECDLLGRALRLHHGNLSAAGRALGIDRNLLRYKLRKHGLRA
jgi:two-component system, NtrC family, response regulator PilR